MCRGEAMARRRAEWHQRASRALFALRWGHFNYDQTPERVTVNGFVQTVTILYLPSFPARVPMD
jgi:hypothetical protein